VWGLCTSSGCGVYFEPYCGKDTNIVDEGIGQGPNVVLDLVQKSKISPGSQVYFDNLFTSFTLLERLSELKIAGTGTMRQNRIHRVPLKKKKDIEKKNVPRGYMEAVYKLDQVCVVWKDNKAVYMASNFHGMGEDQVKVTRYSRELKRRIDVPVPAVIKFYNQYMGGVDLLDSNVAAKRPKYRMKKWWFPFWTWCISVQATQAWRLRGLRTGKKEPYLDFLRELVIGMFSIHGTPPHTPRSLPLGIAGPLGDQVRYDGLNHIPVHVEEGNNRNRHEGPAKRKNCKFCAMTGRRSMKTVFMCEKCAVPLHIREGPGQNCFKANFHNTFFSHFVLFFLTYSF